jgi:hypothetical protein
VSICFDSVAFLRAIIRPILSFYESVVISLIRRITRNLKGNLIRWWIWLKLIRGLCKMVSKEVRVYRERVLRGQDIQG